MAEKTDKEKEAEAAIEKEDAAAQAAVDKSEDLIAKSEAIATRIEDANKEQKTLLDRREAMHVEGILGGKSEGGQGGKEETPTEYKDRIMRGEEDDKKS